MRQAVRNPFEEACRAIHSCPYSGAGGIKSTETPRKQMFKQPVVKGKGLLVKTDGLESKPTHS